MPSAPVTHRQDIAAPAPEVWAVISTAGYLEECHPFCAANPVDRWPGTGSVDRIEYYSGRRLTRSFVGWQEGSGYDIEITDANGPVADVSWRLEAAGEASALTIAIQPRMLGGVPGVVRWAPERSLVRPKLSRYLRAVLSGIAFRVTTGKPVQRNQFGAHCWFSP